MRVAGVPAAKVAKAKAETRTASFVPSPTHEHEIKTGRGRIGSLNPRAGVVHKSKTAPSMGTDQSSCPAGLGNKGEAREKKLAAWLLPANTIKYAGCACACLLCVSGAVLDTPC